MSYVQFGFTDDEMIEPKAIGCKPKAEPVRREEAKEEDTTFYKVSFTRKYSSLFESRKAALDFICLRPNWAYFDNYMISKCVDGEWVEYTQMSFDKILKYRQENQ